MISYKLLELFPKYINKNRKKKKCIYLQQYELAAEIRNSEKITIVNIVNEYIQYNELNEFQIDINESEDMFGRLNEYRSATRLFREILQNEFQVYNSIESEEDLKQIEIKLRELTINKIIE